MLGLEVFENSNRYLEHAKKDERIAALGIGSTPARVIHRENKLRVLLYEPGVTASAGTSAEAGATAGTNADANVETSSPVSPISKSILIVPSLINRHYILDLMPDKSLVRFLLSKGFQVGIIDWGTPGDEDRHLTFDRYADDYLSHSIRAFEKATDTKAPVLLGYCLGGTLAAIHAALHPQNVSGLLALTVPIDFHNSGLLSQWCRTKAFDVDTLTEACGNIPWSLMQSTFQWLKPTMSAVRNLALRKRLEDRDFVDSSLALEVWVNDNVSFPGACYRDFIRCLYRENALVNGTLRVKGQLVDFRRLTCPILNVAAADDHIVPLDATAGMKAIAHGPDVTELITPGGHIGAVISRKASTYLWPRMNEWLLERFAVDAGVGVAAVVVIDSDKVAGDASDPVGVEPMLPPAAQRSTRKRIRPWQTPLPMT